VVELIINGKTISAKPQISVIQALIESGVSDVLNAGCLNGVCGSCSVFVKYAESSGIETELGCQLMVKEGMQVSFVPNFLSVSEKYQSKPKQAALEIPAALSELFPQVDSCRQCGGCTNSCPKGIDVEHFIKLVIATDYNRADELMESCVMCDLCESACPEKIQSQHLGVYLRRSLVGLKPMPSNLLNSINRIKSQEINTDL